MEAKENENKVEEVKNNMSKEINEEKSTNASKEETPEKNAQSVEKTLEKAKTSQDNHSETSKDKTKKKPILGILRRILIVCILLGIVIFVRDTSKYYKNDDITDKTNVIINNKNVTARLKQDIIIENGKIFMSMNDIKNFFDNYIYEETTQDRIITTYDENIAEVYFSGNHMSVNDTLKRVDAVAIKRDGIIYLPISEMINVYNIELEYIEETDIVTMDSIKKEQVKAVASKNISVKDYAKVLSRTVDKVKEGETLIVISKKDNGWMQVRTQNGKIGFVKQDSLEDEITVREEQKKEAQVDGKINMFWDYYSEYAKAPDRSGEKIEGVNVVSPAFFYIDYQGNFQDKVGTSGESYIEWAHENGYKVWPMISNAEAKNIKSTRKEDSSNILKVTSEIMNSYEARKELIQNIVNACEKYDLDGINIDFEYMYEKDRDLFSRFIIELEPRMKRLGVVLSVDVTAPDGSPNWSLCFDRNVIGEAADYIIFMAYDQYSSSKVGTTAGYNWVENNIEKFVGTQCEVESEKIILGIPFYTKIWTETADGEVNSKTVSMKDIESVLPDNVTKTWDDDLKQYYVEYESGSSTKKMWIEDLKSIEAKVSLVNKYNLAGVAAWEKDQELDGTWKVIKETLEK